MTSTTSSFSSSKQASIQASTGPKTVVEQGTWLRLPCCEHAVHPVEIQRHEGNEIAITAPREPHKTWAPNPGFGAEVTLGWSDAGGSFALACRVSQKTLPKLGGTWTLEAIGKGDFVQRRRHIRVATWAPVQLLDHRHDQTVAGTVVDLSESGMRCMFNAWVFDGEDDPFRLTLRLDGALLVVVAKPLWSGQVGAEQVHIGFEFVDLHHSQAARLRSHVQRQILQGNNEGV